MNWIGGISRAGPHGLASYGATVVKALQEDQSGNKSDYFLASRDGYDVNYFS